MKHLGICGLAAMVSVTLLGCGVPLTTTGTAAAVADATLPPPSVISPLAQTQLDDRAVVAAFAALDLAATAADTVLDLRPSFAGTPAAQRLAGGLVGAKTWLNIASKAQRAGQADSYTAALEQAAAALAGAQQAMFDIKGAK